MERPLFPDLMAPGRASATQGPPLPAPGAEGSCSCLLFASKLLPVPWLACSAQRTTLWGTPSLLRHKLQSLLSHSFVYQ